MLVESFNRTRWLDKLRPAGASQKADGPESPMAPIVTTGVLIVEKKKKTFSRVILVLEAMLIFQYRSTEIHELCVSSLRQSHAIFTVLKKVKKLQERVAPFVLLHQSNYACHPYTGVTPRASNP